MLFYLYDIFIFGKGHHPDDKIKCFKAFKQVPFAILSQKAKYQFF